MSHDASRTGAPTNLLHFLRWYKLNGGRPFSILLGAAGDLAPDFGEVADTWSLGWGRWCPGGSRAMLLKEIGLGRWARAAESREIWRFVARTSPTLVYVNSVSSAAAVDTLAPRVPILTHVHELESYLRTQPAPALSRLFGRTRRFVACSNAVRQNLVVRRAVNAERIETVHESIPVTEVRAKRNCREVLRELGVPESAMLVLGCGTMDWRKGSDLFIQLARILTRRRDDVYCAWVGGFPVEVPRFEHDVRLAGLAGRVHYTGMVASSADYLAAADVFVLTSREDPYPLVGLEAAAVGKPIVCFADAGGMPEFVEDDCGFVVPYLDVETMGQRVLQLLDSEECRLGKGKAAQRKVSARHDINVAAPKIAEIIERTIAGQ